MKFINQPIIQRVSYKDFAAGNHYISNNENGVGLIQIVDPCKEFPLPIHHFDEIHQFEFTDVESPTDITWEFKMSGPQGEEIVNILHNAMEKKRDIIVHCIMGISRSGAVVSMAEELGFKSLNENSPFANKYMLDVLRIIATKTIKKP